jgi:hypothetical protein
VWLLWVHHKVFILNWVLDSNVEHSFIHCKEIVMLICSLCTEVHGIHNWNFMTLVLDAGLDYIQDKK